MLKMVLSFTGMCIFLRGHVVLLDCVDQSRSSVSVWITIFIFSLGLEGEIPSGCIYTCRSYDQNNN